MKNRLSTNFLSVGNLKLKNQVTFSMAVILYTHLYFLEGAVRKWVPGTDTIMYVARDVVFVFLLFRLLMRRGQSLGQYQRYSFPPALIFVYMASLLTLTMIQMFSLNTPLMVALVGIRSYIAPLLVPLGALYFGTEQLLRRVIRIFALYSTIQLPLVILQVLSSPLSFINKQVNSESAYFINGEVVRASGLFSAPAGLANYLLFGLACSLILTLAKTRKDKTLGALGIVSAVMQGTLGGNRLAILGMSLVLVGFAIASLIGSRDKGKRRILVLIGISIAALVVSVNIFPNVIASFNDRFSSAAQSEDTLLRLSDQTFGFYNQNLTFIGEGIGANSQAGIAVGSKKFWVEWDTRKWVSELGLLGFFLANLRLLAAAYCAVKAIWASRQGKRELAIVLFAAFPLLAYSQVTQFPTNQALFGLVIGCAFMLLSESDKTGKGLK